MTTAIHPARTVKRPSLLGVFATLAQALIVVGGVPYALIRFVGWPLPHTIPSIATMKTAWELRDFSDRLLIGGLACAIWICWTLTVTSLLAHTVGQAKHVHVRIPHLVPTSLHRLVGKWASAFAVIISLARPAGATVNISPRVSVTNSAPIATTPTRASTNTIATSTIGTSVAPAERSGSTRTWTVGPRESLWDIAEATLGDGGRWKEILDANTTIIHDPDVLPDGATLTIPPATPERNSTKTVTVEAGDNMWALSRHELETPDHHRVKNADVAPYWAEVVKLNEPNIRSGDANLIYPGEHLELPVLDEPPVAVVEPARPPTAPAIVEPVAPTPQVTVPPATIVTPPITTPASRQAVAEATDDHYSVLKSPWTYGLGITAISAAALLAALAARRRRQMQTHSKNKPIPVVTVVQHDLITQLRAIAEPDRLAAVDRTMRYLAAQCAATEVAPTVTIVRVGHHNVELLATDVQTTCPPGFVLLDEVTLTIDPTVSNDTIDEAINDSFAPAPALVTVGNDETGDILVDLERIGALSIEADKPEDATALLTAIAVEQTGLPWSTENTVVAIGLPEAVSHLRGITTITDVDQFIAETEKRVDAQANDLDGMSTHQARLEATEPWPPTLILIGQGFDVHARRLAELAARPGSGLAVIAVAPLPSSTWRLVLTNGRGELEPNGLNLTAIRLHVTKIERDAIDQVVELLTDDKAPDRPEADDEDAGDSEDWDEPTQPSEVEATEVVALLALELPIDVRDQIADVMQPEEIELVLLESTPRLEGIAWNGKNAARADEVITFLALHGPATSREVGEVLWPAKRNASAQVSQAVSRTRALLGEHNGESRLVPATRATPYSLRHVGCDWSRFEKLACLASKTDGCDAIVLLQTALELVNATPFAGRRERAFEWAGEYGYESRMCLVISTAAERLAELALKTGQPDLALWAADKGQLVVPRQQEMFRIRMRAYSAKGDNDGIHREYDAAKTATEEDNGLLSEVDPETRAIFAAVIASPAHFSSALRHKVPDTSPEIDAYSSQKS